MTHTCCWCLLTYLVYHYLKQQMGSNRRVFLKYEDVWFPTPTDYLLWPQTAFFGVKWYNYTMKPTKYQSNFNVSVRHCRIVDKQIFVNCELHVFFRSALLGCMQLFCKTCRATSFFPPFFANDNSAKWLPHKLKHNVIFKQTLIAYIKSAFYLEPASNL